MKLKYLFLALVFAVSASSFSAFADDNDEELKRKINEAVMGVYDKHLTQDPSNYEVRFARANQYYFNGEYENALADVSRCISETPEKESDLLFDELMLRAKLYDELNQLNNENADLKRAFTLKPSALNCVDMMAKLALKQNELEIAENNFNVILRKEPNNFDALYGQAQVEAKRNNYEKAFEYANRAVTLFPAEQQVYLNRSNILEMSGQYDVAAQDLIIAMSVSDDVSKPIARLVEMSDTHYNAVMSSLQEAIDKAPNVGMFYYVRSAIAMQHQHYGQALRNLRSIISYNLYDYHTVYANAARCHYELMQYDEALVNINKAIEQMYLPEYFVLKSKIELMRGKGNNYKAATDAVEQALSLDKTNSDALLQMARLLLAQRKDKEAVAQLDAAIKAHPDCNEALLLRGWLLKYRLNNVSAANLDFATILQNGVNMASLRGFALHEMGRADEARAWAQQIIQDNPLPGGESYYNAAALLSDMGDNAAAMKYFESALANGYGSLFNVKINEVPYVNLKLLRRDSGFNQMLSNYQSNFQERE